MDRAAAAIVLVCLIVCAGSSAGYLLIMPSLLPGIIELQLPDIGGWLLDRLPAPAFNALFAGLGCLAFATLLVASSVSLIAGLRAWRTGLAIRHSVSLTACGIVLGTLLAGGPLCYYAYMRGSLDRIRTASRHTMEGIRRKLESGDIPTAQRHQVWLLYARSVYWDLGIQVQMPDERGGNSLYEPTEKEVAARKANVEMMQGWRPPYLYTAAAVVLVVICLGLGLFTPLRREPPLRTT